MKRGALWLLTEIGEGNIFTKEQVRTAFPGISQADRRIRDLRDHEWIIHTNKDDASLRADEQRFVKAGIHVWEPGRLKPTAKAVTAKQREAVFAADDYQCVVCGVTGGESYPEASHETAQLSVSRRSVRLPGGDIEVQLVTECRRCRSGSSGAATDLKSMLSEVDSLDHEERALLTSWVSSGRRTSTRLDGAWSSYRRLPSESRDEVRKHLGSW
jgi:hypothetical protein